MNKLINAGSVNNTVSGTKNKIINGDMIIDQRNNGAAQNALGGAAYLVDRWVYGASVVGKFNAQQLTTTMAGFPNCLCLTTASAYTVAASDYFMLIQKIEGINCRDLAWGTANAQPVSLQFKVYSSLVGTFSGAIRNSAITRAFVFSYSITQANTWTTVNIIVPGDTTGTWLINTSVGMELAFNLGSSATYLTSTGWSGGTYVGATGSVSVVGTAGATFYITGVQLEVGKVATNFEYLQYGLQLALCQRYYEIGFSTFGGYAIVGASNCCFFTIPYKVCKRTNPTVTRTDTYLVNCSGAITLRYFTIDSISGYINSTAAGATEWDFNWVSSAEL